MDELFLVLDCNFFKQKMFPQCFHYLFLRVQYARNLQGNLGLVYQAKAIPLVQGNVLMIEILGDIRAVATKWLER